MPGPLAFGVGGATPEVDGELAVDPDGDGGADFVALTEVGFEGVADALEGGGAGAVDGGTCRCVLTSLLTTMGVAGPEHRAYFGSLLRLTVEAESRLRLSCDSA